MSTAEVANTHRKHDPAGLCRPVVSCFPVLTRRRPRIRLGDNGLRTILNNKPVPMPEPIMMCLADCAMHEMVELVHIELPEDEAECLLERGVVPGCSLCAMRRSPAGDPIVRVDGMLLAVRREMAGCLYVRRLVAEAA